MKIRSVVLWLACCWLSVFTLHAQTAVTYQLSTHVLDISQGAPAPGIIVSLYRYDTETREWEFVDKAVTGADGRIAELLPAEVDNFGVYKLRFETEGYFTRQNLTSIYPYIEVCFYIRDKDHYHIPITVGANGYSTYRGS